MIKQIIKSTLSIWILVLLTWLCQAKTTLTSNFPYDPDGKIQTECKDGTYYDTDLWNCISIKEDEKRWWNETIIRRLLGVFGLKKDTNNDLKFIDYAKAIINMALGLISLIALIMTIYTFYLMFFTENEAWIKKAKWNLIGIFIALAIIWLAWLIVSFIFWRYQSNWKDNEQDIGTNTQWQTTMSRDKTNKNQIYLTI